MDADRQPPEVPRGAVALTESAAGSRRGPVIDAIRADILSGALAPGQKLIERSLCARFGVSRTLLREALQRLEAEGLIANVLHRGPSVADITREEAVEIFQIRRLLEAEAGRGFVLHGDDEDLERLRLCVAAMGDDRIVNDSDAQMELKNQFYAILLANCGNRILVDMHTMLNNRVILLRRLALAHPGRIRTTIDELSAIATALAARDPQRASDLLSEHVDSAAALALEGFDRAGRW